MTASAVMPKGPVCHDLIPTLTPHLDRHMLFPLLEFLDSLLAPRGDGVDSAPSLPPVPYTPTSVARSRLDLLGPTHMVDYAMDVYGQLYPSIGSVPAEMELKRAAVLDRLEELKGECAGIETLLGDTDRRSGMEGRGEWNVAGLERAGISEKMLESYREYSKFQYDCGDYHAAGNMISVIIGLHATAPGEDGGGQRSSGGVEDVVAAKAAQLYHLRTLTEDLSSLLWGKLSCEILLENWDGAYAALQAVRSSIEERAAAHSSFVPAAQRITALQALTQRAWLLHWSLFVFWNDPKRGLDRIVDWFTSEKYMQAVQTVAPHLLRYLAAAVVLNKRSRNGQHGLLKDLVRTIEHCDYRDPVVDFVDRLYIKFDFEAAQEKLVECELVLATDFFLCKQTADFMKEARVFIFENYCRIHQKIDISALSSRLAMAPDEAERWIVDLIRNASLDAKIDSETNCVVMGKNGPSGSGGGRGDIHRRIVDKSKYLTARTASLGANLKSVMAEAKRQKESREKALRDDDF